MLTYIDLFCGIGGFHQALDRMGAKCVLACDKDKDCREIYTLNYGIAPVDNVEKIDPLTMPDFDILCGGFPCQAFSQGGHKKCFEDKRGLLFDEIIRIAKVKQPKFMFLENVKHILKVSNGQVIEYIKEKIKDTGSINKEQTRDYSSISVKPGVPQVQFMGEQTKNVCAYENINDNYRNADLLSAFKSNPYTQPLGSFA